MSSTCFMNTFIKDEPENKMFLLLININISNVDIAKNR